MDPEVQRGGLPPNWLACLVVLGLHNHPSPFHAAAGGTSAGATRWSKIRLLDRVRKRKRSRSIWACERSKVLHFRTFTLRSILKVNLGYASVTPQAYALQVHFRNNDPEMMPGTTRGKCISHVRASRTL